MTPDSLLKNWLSKLDQLEGWMDSSSGYISAKICQLQSQKGFKGNIAEIGVYCGKYLIGLCTALKDDESAIAIDLFEDQQKNQDYENYLKLGSIGIKDLTVNKFLNNFKSFLPNKNVHIIKQASTELLPENLLINNFKVRFISIDGGHLCSIIKNDLTLAENVISDEGIIAIDDILNAQWPGVVTATIRYLDQETSLRPVAFISNKLLCSKKHMVKFYKNEIRKIAPNSLQRTDVEFSNYYADQYWDSQEDIINFLKNLP